MDRAVRMAFFLCAAVIAASTAYGRVLSRKRPVYQYAPGAIHHASPPGVAVDPVPPLGEGDEDLLKDGLTPAEAADRRKAAGVQDALCPHRRSEETRSGAAAPGSRILLERRPSGRRPLLFCGCGCG